MSELEQRLAAIDRRRTELEITLSAMPHTHHCCEHDCEREGLEIELRNLRALRADLFAHLRAA